MLLFLLKEVITKFNFWYMNKSDAKNMMKNSNLNKRPQMISCVKYFKNNKYINLLVYDRELLKKYNAIWDKISSLLKNNLIVYQCTILNSLELR